jgi:Zn-dependent protease with chaperone function
VLRLALLSATLATLVACTTIPERAYYPDPSLPETRVVSHALWRAAVAAGDDPRRWSFALIATQDVSAYAAEDAMLYVTRGLTRQPAGVLEPLVAAQVSHEVLGHRGERRTLSVALGASFTVLGVAIPGLGLLDYLASPLIVRAWTREQVLTADRKTVEVLAEMGYAKPRRALADALRTAAAVNGPPQRGVLAVEPRLEARLAALEPLEPVAAAPPAAR